MKITKEERRRCIQELLDRLESDPDRTPAELFRSARLVPGWSITRGPHQMWTVDGADRTGRVLRRDDLIALLITKWAPAAHAALAAMEGLPPDLAPVTVTPADALTLTAALLATPKPALVRTVLFFDDGTWSEVLP